jgi:spermidine/putrescine transport system permease protein
VGLYCRSVRRVNLLLGWWTGIVLVFLYAPIVLLVALSFNASRLNVVWRGFTLSWYREVFRDRPLMDALLNSVLIAAGTTVVSVTLGTAGAWLCYRYRFRFIRAIRAAIFVPMLIPEIILGISLLIFFTLAGMGLGYTTVIISHVTFCFPFVLIAIEARLAGLDPSLDEAAMDLGATPMQAFVRVIVPYLMPAIISGALMCFMLSLDELIVTYFTTGPNSATLPIKVFGMAKVGADPKLNAISTLFIVATVILVISVERLRNVAATPASPPRNNKGDARRRRRSYRN